jgi:DNA polymerase-3 subunit delta
MIYNDPDQIINEVKSGSPKPVYILHGEEPYYIDQIVSIIERSVLTDAEKAFNQIVTYGRDIDIKNIQDEARQFPMMSQRRVVIVKEAQAFKDIKLLDSYIENPVGHTVLVIAHVNKKIDGRWSWVSKAKKSPHIVFFHSEPVKAHKLNAWLTSHLRAKSRKIDARASQLLCEYLGSDLKKLVNEIEKIELNIAVDKVIDADDVERYVGISKDYNVFELLKHLSAVNKSKAFFITENLARNVKKNPIQIIIPSLFNHFQRLLILSQANTNNEKQLASIIKVPPFAVREFIAARSKYRPDKIRHILNAITQADLKSKGIGSRRNDPGELLRELIQEILYHAA